jgi:hypothetical protein
MKCFLFLRAFWVLLLVGVVAGCSPTPKTDTLSDFVGDAFTIEKDNVNETEPIMSILAVAKQQASKTILLKKENARAAFTEAQKHKNVFIVVGHHTIVKITDFTDCQKSTSWAAEMPYGVALVQNKGLNETSDYVNQIIGKPDNQTRWLLMFD